METQPLFNPNDRLAGRDGGPYLDLEEAREAEKRRAVAEGREPDFNSLTATAGIPLVNAGQLLETRNTGGINSQPDPTLLNDAAVDALVKSKDVLLDKFSDRPVEEVTDEVPEDTSRQVGKPSHSNPVGLSEADKKEASKLSVPNKEDSK